MFSVYCIFSNTFSLLTLPPSTNTFSKCFYWMKVKTKYIKFTECTKIVCREKFIFLMLYQKCSQVFNISLYVKKPKIVQLNSSQAEGKKLIKYRMEIKSKHTKKENTIENISETKCCFIKNIKKYKYILSLKIGNKNIIADLFWKWKEPQG